MLESIDWIIIAAYFVLSLGIGLWYSKRAGKNSSEFFLGGRNMPWYLAGISMVATTFAADTPLAVNELVVQNGISGNWIWWSALTGGMLTTFFFARMWRRAEVLTELEFIELRYGGKQAAFLRGFKAVYLGLIMNVLIIGWVNVALMTILKVMFGLPDDQVLLYTGIAMVITAFYSSLSGLWGVAVTDAVQFLIAMAGCIILAVIVVNSDKIGGIDGLKAQLADKPWAFDFFPSIGNNGAAGGAYSITMLTFLAFVGVQWWSSWYPGAEPGGGGYVAQRMMSAKNEKHAIFATLFFQIAHYALRPWPWIIVGLCCLVLYPGLETPRDGYVMAMNDFLPAGLKGMLLVAFLAAYMSTISTQLNWGASYLVNDLYKRFKRPESTFANVDAAEKHYVLAGRVVTILIMGVALWVTQFITSISGVWAFIMECGAGLGLVLILRWYWWRINAWSEIAATLAPFVAYAVCKFGIEGNLVTGSELLWWQGNKITFFITVIFTTIAWLVVTFLTKPEDDKTLSNFYNKVRPMGNWGKFTLPANVGKPGYLVICWLSSIVMIYSTLFFIGKLIFKEYNEAGIYAAVIVVSFIVLRYASMKTKILD
jgi:SSS family solute:Na+ symporter